MYSPSHSDLLVRLLTFTPSAVTHCPPTAAVAAAAFIYTIHFITSQVNKRKNKI